MTLGLEQANRSLPLGINFSCLILLIIGRRKKCLVEGNSMAPTINKGDFVVYKPYEQSDRNLLTGSIVISEHPLIKNHLIIKRIHKKKEEGVLLAGDNYQESSDSKDFGLIKYNQLIGIVERIIPHSY